MVYNTKQYTIGGIRFLVNFLSPFLCLNKSGGSSRFENIPLQKGQDWVINFATYENIDSSKWQIIFIGSDQYADDLPYKWSIIKQNNLTGIKFEYENYPNLKGGVALIDEENKTISTSLEIHEQDRVQIDPFLHPLGIHILQYIAHLNKGFVIHASTVSYNNKGYLFSAISGTGKTTMAGLWKKCGAQVVNDDRLLILPNKGEYFAYNTPMPHYQDLPKKVKLHKAFLINQSKTNYIKPLSSTKGILGLLGNCMQFQYDNDQVQERLSALHNIAETCGVYECGFKPDTDIVELIRQQLG